MKILGRHLVAELTGCNCATLDNLPQLEDYLNESVRRSGATIVQSVFHRYNPQGVSGVVVIAESHISIHTWPEYGYAAVDFFTCGDAVDPYKAYDFLKLKLESRHGQLSELKRGMPSDTDEKIDHKPIARSAATGLVR